MDLLEEDAVLHHPRGVECVGRGSHGNNEVVVWQLEVLRETKTKWLKLIPHDENAISCERNLINWDLEIYIVKQQLARSIFLRAHS